VQFSPSMLRTVVHDKIESQVSRKGGGESRSTQNGQRVRTFALQHNKTTDSGNQAVHSHEGGFQFLKRAA